MFCNQGFTKKIFLLSVCYYNKLDTKFIFLRMFDRKKLFYSLNGGILEVFDNLVFVIFGHLTAHNLYKVDLKKSTNLVIILHQARKAKTFKLAAKLSVWHRCFAHLNKAAIK